MVETLIFQGLIGLSLAMYIWLVAAGLTLVFGVLGVLNFAHGSLYMLGAYLTETCTALLGGNFWLGLLLATIIVAVLGVGLECFFFRPMYRLPLAYQLLMTFAFVLIFDDLVKMVWGPVYRVPPTPKGLEGSLSILGRAFPVYNVFIIGLGPLVALLLWLILEKTSWGKMIRASASSREMASAIGINIKMLFTTVFAFGAWLAALGGGLSIPIRAVSPGMGTFIIIEAFVVVVIGGLGSLKGAFIGAVLIGLLEAYGTLFLPVFEMFFIFFLMAVVLIVQPGGLFGTQVSHEEA
ncbi:MAG: branched-chain amino acid ABC transporter permease [candidate division NC10 bacterium]|nr:branched-chain amino acid ABC transporter permease [candidate division NC10 bacterium]